MSERRGHARLPVRSTRACRVQQRNGLVVTTLVIETEPTSDRRVSAAFREILMGADPVGGVVLEPKLDVALPVLSVQFKAGGATASTWSIDLPAAGAGDREKLEALAASGLLVLTPAPAAVDAENILRTPSVSFEVDAGSIRAFLEAQA